MMRMRLRAMTTAFNAAAAQYAFARLEIAAAHPRVIAPPVIERLGVREARGDGGRLWRTALRQLREADGYVKTGASAVARRDKAWAHLAAAFAELKAAAAGIEALRVSVSSRVRKRRT